jgi:MFS family permease
VGTTIEFYDFFIYGTAAALVFPRVFFPALGSTAGTVASFATFAVAFVARPVGAVAFGHFRDRIGRKRTLISTLLLMGAATVLIGLLPGAATIGVAAPHPAGRTAIRSGFRGGVHSRVALTCADTEASAHLASWGTRLARVTCE